MNKSFRNSAPAWALFSLAVIYFAVLSASIYKDGMTVIEFVPLAMSASLKDICWTSYTPRFIFIFLMVYACCIALYHSSRHNRRPGIEHGSAPDGAACMS